MLGGMPIPRLVLRSEALLRRVASGKACLPSILFFIHKKQS